MSEQSMHHIKRLRRVRLTRSEQLQPVFIIGVVIPDAPNATTMVERHFCRLLLRNFSASRGTRVNGRVFSPYGPRGPSARSLSEALDAWY
jgi:hypothetical protein